MNISKFIQTVLAIFILTTAGFAADGDLDTTFNPVLSPATGISLVVINQVVVQADGKILVAGSFSAVNGTARNGIMRLNADGSLDTSFNPGTGASDSNLDSIAIAPDGKILIGGVFNSFNGTPRQRVARLNVDGSLDAAFVPGAAATNRINAIAVQPDGKVLIGVALSTIKRLNTDGTLDDTFTTTMTPQVGVIEIKMQADGKILIGGGWDFLNGTEYRFGLARLNASGTNDTSFVPHNNDFTLNRASVAEIVPQADGKVVAVGNLQINSTTGNKHIVRFNADGTIDNTFDSATDANNTIFSVVRQPDGKYIIAGSFTAYNGTPVNRVARLNSNGSLDNTFNANVNNNTVYSAAQQPDGKIVIGGFFTQVSSTTRTGLARLQNSASSVPNKAAICDYDGDGKTDFAVRRVVSGTFNWYIGLSGGGSTAVQFGRSGDRVLCGDFDGDRKTDVTVWRATGANPIGYFYILESATNTFRAVQFGQNGDNPNVIGDYNGDGKSDLAVYRPGAAAGEQSFFYYANSLDNSSTNFTTVQWGTNGDRPYVGDFDGDGKTDVAVQRTANSTGIHYVRQSSNNTMRAFYYGTGASGDTIVPGDYNGDGRTDIGVWRNETGGRVWYVSTDFGATFTATTFGTTAAQSALGDYDGDGKSDIAVYQNDTNGGGFNFFVLKSSDGMLLSYRWGQNLDAPIATFNQY